MTADPVILLAAGVFLLGVGSGGLVAWTAAGVRLRGGLTAARTRADLLADQLAHARTECEAVRTKLGRYAQAYTAAKTQLAESQAGFRRQQVSLDDAQDRLTDAFGALAAQALARNSHGFLQLAEERLKAVGAGAAADLDARRSAVEALVRPVTDALQAYQQAAASLEDRRQRDMGAVAEQLRSLTVTHASLQTETARLVQALKSPQVRGRWGEVALRRTAELAGMSAHCDFFEQVATESGARPDMVVRLPNDRTVVIDAKVPLAGFLQWTEATTDEARLAARDRHARQVMGHVTGLSSKEYWGQFRTSSPEFVVLFLPNDSILAVAAEHDPELVEAALARKVVLATPSTLVALLRAVEFGWRQRLAVENAEQIRCLGQELADRLAVLVEHFSRVGGALGKAVEAYNAAAGSFEARVLPAARRFKDLGAGGRKTVEGLPAVGERPTGGLAADPPSLFPA